MKTRLFAPFLVLLAALAVIPPVAHAQTVDLSSSANPSSTIKTVPVQQLSNRVEKLIRIVERSTLPCETRNAVVERLRVLDDALLSGRRSAARALVQAWRQHFWSMEAARVIGPDIGSPLQNQLSEMVDEIGYGWSERRGPTRHWKPLPVCDSSAAGVGATSAPLVGSSDPTITDASSSAKIFLQMILGSAPYIGPALSGMVELLWPKGSSETSNGFQDLVDKDTYELVQGKLNGLMKLMVDPESSNGWEDQIGLWEKDCAYPPPNESDICVKEANDLLWSSFSSKLDNFSEDGAIFQLSGKEVKLLPLYAQYENLYLAFLRDGMMLHEKYWSKVTGKDPHDIAGMAMAAELNPANTDRGVGYVNSVYNMGLPPVPADPSDWNHPFDYEDLYNAHLQYIREQTLKVLDYRDTWKYLDPRAYPNGVPGGVKLTRMIYSNLFGTPRARPNLPHNVAGPLKEISVWTKHASSINELTIDAMQATSPPLLGPAQSGAITGDTAQPANHAHYYNLRALGPIIGVKAETYAIGFVWATGRADSWQGYRNWTTPSTFALDGEVLATLQAIHYVDLGSRDGNVVDSFVSGFRYPDSFNPAGQLIGVHSGWCLDLPGWKDGSQAMLNICQPKAAQIWTYDPGLQQISVTNPAEWSDTNPTDSGKHCLDAAGGDTATGTPVVISACDDGAYSSTAGVSSQRWIIAAVGDGIAKITNRKSGLVLDAYLSNGVIKLQLNTDYGNIDQQWHTPDPLTGEIHGIGSGRCLDVPSASTTPGTQVQIYDCNGTGAQQWTYNPTNKELVYAKAPSLCLEARGGGTTAGTAVQINTCTGAPEQKWTLQGDGGTITNDKSLLVLGVAGGDTGNGTLVHLSLVNGTQAEWWSRTSSPGGALYAVGAGKCLDVPSWGSAVIRACANPLSATQTWTYHTIAQTFTVNSPSGPKCLDLNYGFYDPGTEVVVKNCNGRASQRWSRNFGDSTITNVAAGLVLDVSGGGTADGTPVLIWGVHSPVSSNQQWVWSQH